MQGFLALCASLACPPIQIFSPPTSSSSHALLLARRKSRRVGDRFGCQRPAPPSPVPCKLSSDSRHSISQRPQQCGGLASIPLASALGRGTARTPSLDRLASRTKTYGDRPSAGGPSAHTDSAHSRLRPYSTSNPVACAPDGCQQADRRTRSDPTRSRCLRSIQALAAATCRSSRRHRRPSSASSMQS